MLAEGRDARDGARRGGGAGQGRDAILAFRFDTSELGTTWTEICAYGTAVTAVKRA